jgi:hypothetical protein
MVNRLKFRPLKYKVLLVLLSVSLGSLATFSYFTSQVFSDDKKLSILDLNFALLKGAVTDIRIELKSRLFCS